MVEPEKPFACAMPDCGMTFTNEDHLHVHTKKHDMVLQFGCEQKAAFVADQTPTPTRFIRNCEEVGLFQDLQNVNPFDEGFKRAMEAKQDLLSLEPMPSTEELHTPQMFPCLDASDSVFSATNHRNITISRSSSDENGVKEFETTTISKLTNEVTTISRIVEKHEEPKTKDAMKNSVSYTNNVIKIHSNLEIRKDMDKQIDDTVIKESLPKDVYERLQLEVPPIMSQKSIDYVVDSLTSDFITEVRRDDLKIKERSAKDDSRCTKEDSRISKEDSRSCKEDSRSSKEDSRSCKEDSRNPKEDSRKEDSNAKGVIKSKDIEDFEVILKLPSGHQIKLVNAEEKPKNAKDLLKKVLTEKVEAKKPQINNLIVPNIIPSISSGTLIPVSVINTTIVPKIPLKVFDKRPAKRKFIEKTTKSKNNNSAEENITKIGKVGQKANDLDSRSAASRRYRARLKETMITQAHENKLLKEQNDKLVKEHRLLKSIIIDHVKNCHNEDDLRELQAKLTCMESND